MCALFSMAQGGAMCIKLYTFFERFTVELFMLCSEFFEVFKVVKPITSKPANSEVYVVGRGFMTSKCREKFANKYGGSGDLDALLKATIDLLLKSIAEDKFGGLLTGGSGTTHMALASDDITMLETACNSIYRKQALFV